MEITEWLRLERTTVGSSGPASLLKKTPRAHYTILLTDGSRRSPVREKRESTHLVRYEEGFLERKKEKERKDRASSVEKQKRNKRKS